MSRIALALLLAWPAQAIAAADPVTAEHALENYRRKPTAEIDCPRAQDPDEITVCGRRDAASAYRLPLPVEPVPGERVLGEPVLAVSLSKEETCTNIGQSHGCGSVDILGLALRVAQSAVRAATEALDPEE